MQVYELTLKDDSTDELGIQCVSIVDSPAIEIELQYFDKMKRLEKFLDEEKRIIIAPAMIPNMKIYRNDGTNEYEVFFSPETIFKLRERMMKNGNFNKINIQHETIVSAISLLETWIVESDNDKIYNHYSKESVPVGSLILCYKVDNNDVWKLIKDKVIKGFSVETYTDYVLKSDEEFKTQNIKQIISQNLSVFEKYNLIKKIIFL